MRTAELATAAGVSVQHVRDLEAAGVLPVAERTESGYRIYREVHRASLHAYRALSDGLGPIEARALMVAAHRSPVPAVLEVIDSAHAALDDERRRLALTERALVAITDETLADVRRSDSMSVGELADALGVRASTLRYWDGIGLVCPERSTTHRVRRYLPHHVRDARIAAQLRAAGFRPDHIATALDAVRSGTSVDDVRHALTVRRADLARRSRALVRGCAWLDAILVDA